MRSRPTRNTVAVPIPGRRAFSPALVDDEHSIRNFADWLFREHGSAPKRFRAWARLGNAERHNGEWISRADLPIWEPGVGEEHLRARFGESA